MRYFGGKCFDADNCQFRGVFSDGAARMSRSGGLSADCLFGPFSLIAMMWLTCLRRTLIRRNMSDFCHFVLSPPLILKEISTEMLLK